MNQQHIYSRAAPCAVNGRALRRNHNKQQQHNTQAAPCVMENGTLRKYQKNKHFPAFHPILKAILNNFHLAFKLMVVPTSHQPPCCSTPSSAPGVYLSVLPKIACLQ
ncbi:hypothetical protein A2U01_0057310, partial [Trifolium medium]|nr:hypothetical protein [Trifolium medium]